MFAVGQSDLMHAIVLQRDITRTHSFDNIMVNTRMTTLTLITKQGKQASNTRLLGG